MADDKWAQGRAMRRKLMGDAYADKLDKNVYTHPIMEKFAAYTQEAVFGGLWMIWSRRAGKIDASAGTSI